MRMSRASLGILGTTNNAIPSNAAECAAAGGTWSDATTPISFNGQTINLPVGCQATSKTPGYEASSPGAFSSAAGENETLVQAMAPMISTTGPGAQIMQIEEERQEGLNPPIPADLQQYFLTITPNAQGDITTNLAPTSSTVPSSAVTPASAGTASSSLTSAAANTASTQATGIQSTPGTAASGCFQLFGSSEPCWGPIGEYTALLGIAALIGLYFLMKK